MNKTYRDSKPSVLDSDIGQMTGSEDDIQPTLPKYKGPFLPLADDGGDDVIEHEMTITEELRIVKGGVLLLAWCFACMALGYDWAQHGNPILDLIREAMGSMLFALGALMMAPAFAAIFAPKWPHRESWMTREFLTVSIALFIVLGSLRINQLLG